MKHYKIYDIDITIKDDNLLIEKLKSRLLNGVWEAEEVKALEGLNPNSTILDLGACIGVTSCVANKKLKDNSKHVAVEGNPFIIQQLSDIRDQNLCGFIIENCIIGDSTEGNFYIHPTMILSGSANLSKGRKSIKVKHKTIQELEQKHCLRFDVLIMDIEHGEYELFEKHLFPNDYVVKFHTIICEFHNPGQKMKSIMNKMNKYGYSSTKFSQHGHGVIRFTRLGNRPLFL